MMKQNLKAILSIVTLVAITVMAVQLTYIGFKATGCILFSSLIWAWFSIFHSCGHNAYFTSRKLNDFIGYVASVIVGIPYYSWKIHHATHHKWIGYVGIDPTSFEGELPPKEKMKIFNILWKTWIPFISLSHVCTHLWNIKAVMEHVQKSKTLKRKTIFSFAIIPVAHFILIRELGFSFYLPWAVAMIFFLLSSDVILLSQHALLPMKKAEKTSILRPLKAEEHHRYTRSISFGHFIDRFILLNFGEHVRHHRYPLKAHFDLPKTAIEGENRVNGWTWIKTIKKMHIRDVLQGVIE